jgi:F-type H+-transporting ATPase subunit alpha
MEYTVIVSAGSSEPAAMSYIAPYAGVSIAEYFMDQGKDVLIIYDDLSKHAVAYREISLLLRRPPGREAYPGDVFYLHSRLLERACRRNEKYGGGSITAFPIIETQAGDISAYIPTNVISITDGQIFLETDLFYKGIRPAVNVGSSVSRVGSSAQIKAMKKVAGTLKLDLAQFRELEAFSQFGSDLDESTKKQLERGKRAVEVLKQLQYAPVKTEHQVVTLYALVKGFMDDVPVERIKEFESELVDYTENNAKTFYKEVKESKMWTDKGEAELKKAIEDFKTSFK